ncbi:toxin [Caenimonas koreensis DSM 17982]|uniref:Toxin n=1 Tax=Caenimonas koreensis DSM 17982 TaxID=1121255 RepID=A0A844B058_9BURK|nr:toxin [Caenimonas koreensis]MRD48078.1 toxin [Caenimonas koreensis DSM 17982]
MGLGDAQRIVIVGMAGAGKTTLGQRLAQLTAIPHTELDGLFWGPDWEPRLPAFHDDVRRVAAGERWITDGNYSTVRDILWPRAQLVVWLNLPFTTIFRRVLLRTVQRSFKGTQLWQGNRESWRRAFFSRESLLWWVIKHRARYQRQFSELRASGKFAGLAWIELKTPEEVEQFVAICR